MASLSELMFQSASNAVSNVPENKIADGFAVGAQLAQKQQQLQMQQERLQNMKAVADATKDGFGVKEMKTYAELPPKMQKVYIKHMEQKAIERGKPYSPQFLEGLKAAQIDPAKLEEATLRYDKALAESQRLGKPTEELAAAKVEFADVAYGGDISKLAEYDQSRTRANIMAQTQLTKQQTQITATEEQKQREFDQLAQKKLKEKAGTMFADFKIMGGEAGVQKKLDGLKEVKKLLESRKIDTRTWYTIGSELLPWGETKKRVGLIDPALKSAMDKVEGAVSLKGALDSQFSKAEADLVYARAFDVNATREQNIDKIDAMIKELEQNKESAYEMYREQQLWKGPKMGGEMGAAKRQTEADANEQITPQPEVDALVSGIKAHLDAGTPGEDIFNMLKKAKPNVPDDVLRQYIRKAQGAK